MVIVLPGGGGQGITITIIMDMGRLRLRLRRHRVAMTGVILKILFLVNFRKGQNFLSLSSNFGYNELLS
jgi:hypothetical protein